MSHYETTRPLAHTVDSACRTIGIGRTKLYALIASGQLEGRRVAGRTVVTDASLRALVDAAPRIGGTV